EGWSGGKMVEQVGRELPWGLKQVRRIVCEEAVGVLRRLRERLKPEVRERVYGVLGSAEGGGAWGMYRVEELSGEVGVRVRGEELGAGVKVHLLDRGGGPGPEGGVGEVYGEGGGVAVGYEGEGEGSEEGIGSGEGGRG